MYADASKASVRHSTVVDNTAPAGDGGAFAMTGAGSSITVGHSILHGNTAATGPIADDTLSIDWSILDDVTDLAVVGSNNLVGVDPQLGPLADNGGRTPTHRPDPFGPAIDAGDPAAAGAPDYDQRGTDRVIGVIDIGSVEIQEEERPLWVPLVPARLLDTRADGETVDGLHEGGGMVAGGTQVAVQAGGRAGIPDDAEAIVVNMTSVGATGNGFFVAHACLPKRPNAAGLNYTASANLGNEVIVGLDGGGELCVFVRTTAHVVLDVVGYVPAGSDYTSVPPARLLETRSDGSTVDGKFNGVAKPGAEGTIEIDVAGRGGVGPSASAAVLYIAAVDAPAAGFLTAWNCKGQRPTASSLNYVAGVNRGNEIVAPLSATGTLCIFTKQAIDVTVDVVGFLPKGTELRGLPKPSRLLDTRAGAETVDGKAAGGGKLPGGKTYELDVVGRAGIHDDATTVVMNITAVGAPAPGNLVVYPCGPKPLAASLNYVAGVNGGNELVAGLSDSGTVCIWTLRTLDVTVDVSAFTRPLPVEIDEPTMGS